METVNGSAEIRGLSKSVILLVKATLDNELARARRERESEPLQIKRS